MPSAWSAWYNGPSRIRQYRDRNVDALIDRKVYGNPSLKAVFDAYARVYPDVCSRRCADATEELEVALKKEIAANRSLKTGITFIPMTFHRDAFDSQEPDNFIALVPSDFYNPLTASRDLIDPAWYDNDRKRGIIYFYPGAVPLEPVGNLWEKLNNMQKTYGEDFSADVFTSLAF